MTTTITLTGSRLHGELPVHFGRSSNWARQITYGPSRFGETTVTVNNVTYELASLVVVEQAGEWRAQPSRCMRRINSHGPGAWATDKARRAIHTWAAEQAPRLAELNPDAFDGTEHLAHTSTDWTRVLDELNTDLHIAETYAEVTEWIQDPGANLEIVPHPDRPKARWKVPQRFVRSNHGIGAQQPGTIVATCLLDGQAIAWVINTERHDRPTTHGAILVPLTMTQTIDSESA